VLSALASSGTFDHPALGPVLYEVTEVSDNPDIQVEQVIGMMKRYASSDAHSKLFERDVELCAAGGGLDPITDVWTYLNRHSGTRGMKFVSDEHTGSAFNEVPQFKWRPLVEALIRPVDEAWLPNPQGDCDDFSMYGAAHLLARGVPCSYATVAADEVDPSLYSHVYLVAYPKEGSYAGQRVPLDLSHGHFPGWETESRFGKFREWPVTGGMNYLGVGLLVALSILIYRCLA
jgi:hypothetical protein